MTNKITCPNCSHQFDVEEALAGKLEARYKNEFQQKLAEQNLRIQQEKDVLETERKKFQEAKDKENVLFKEKLKKEMELERERITIKEREALQETMTALEKENQERKNENKSLKEKEVALLKKENLLKEQQEELHLNLEKQLLEKQQEIENKARLKERESFELEKRQLQKQIEDNKKLAEEMKRKAEQGSMQMQGEVQELALEELLMQTYPFDSITEVAKGVKGADVIQTVINNVQQSCGSIVYESKRTKSFANEWTEKLKEDQLLCKADFAVIVTESMPKDMERFGQKNGVWICGFHEVQSLSLVLRQMLIRTQSIQLSQENKGDKMEQLYSYLTSNEFVQHVKRIVENYEGMLLQLNREKRAMEKLWKEREKQIETVQSNLAGLFGSIKGIAGSAIDTGGVMELE